MSLESCRERPGMFESRREVLRAAGLVCLVWLGASGVVGAVIWICG